MPAVALPPSALDKMAFLAGHWRGERDDVVIEEMWLAPAGGVAQSTVRLLKGGEVGTIELIVAAAEKDCVVLRYNHFYSDYRTWETDGPIALILTKAEPGEVVFTNLESPPRHAREMGYRQIGPDTLNSWVIVIDADGKLAQHSFDFERVRTT
jgi:hypothetical protein